MGLERRYRRRVRIVAAGLDALWRSALNQLVSLTDGADRIEYSYDGGGSRVGLTVVAAGVTTAARRYVFCGARPCEERTTDGQTVVRRFLDFGAQQVGSFMLTRDHLGSVREVSNSTGQLEARNDYDPYGHQTRMYGLMDLSVFDLTTVVRLLAECLDESRGRPRDSGE